MSGWSLYFALRKGIDGVYPFNKDDLSKADYVEFAHMMEKYLKPRMSGINRLDIYTKGYAGYLKDRGIRATKARADSCCTIYKQLCSYMQFEDCGTVLGRGCGTPSMTRASRYPQLAYELGKSIYNQETEAAMLEARDIIAGKQEARRYSSAKELFDELDI